MQPQPYPQYCQHSLKQCKPYVAIMLIAHGALFALNLHFTPCLVETFVCSWDKLSVTAPLRSHNSWFVLTDIM